MNEKLTPTLTEFDAQKYFKKTEELLRGISPEPEAEHVYPLGGATEWLRMEIQNNIEYGLFGAVHQEHHRRLSELGFNPKRIAIIGVDPHGVMAKNIEIAYPHAEKIAIDLNPEKIAQSQREIAKNPDVNQKFTWVVGDATKILPEIGKVDLVDAQLVLIWGKNKAPLFYNSENGPFPTRQMLVRAMSDALTPDGLITINDLITRKWHVETTAQNKEQSELSLAVENANQFTSLLWKVGWEQAGGISWESDQQLAETVITESLGELMLNQNLSANYYLPEGGPTDPITSVYALMAPAATDMIDRTEQQIKTALSANWPSIDTKEKLSFMLSQIQKVSPILRNLAEGYVKTVQRPGVKTVSAPIAALVFQNSHV